MDVKKFGAWSYSYNTNFGLLGFFLDDLGAFIATISANLEKCGVNMIQTAIINHIIMSSIKNHVTNTSYYKSSTHVK